jgi:outer membrane protein OmpA-like peptidoglycan-associated protein
MGTDTGQGLALGAASGAALGAIIDHGDPWAGVLIGAAGGALAGSGIGHFMDQRKQDLAKTLQPQVDAGNASVQLLAGKAISVDMTGQSAFSPGSAVINTTFLATLEPIAKVLRTYGKMTVQIIGHPDAGGTQAERLNLANQRAEAVRNQMLGMGVPPALIAASGTSVSDYNDGRAVLILRPIITGGLGPPPSV